MLVTQSPIFYFDMQCRHIFINSILSNKYFVTLNQFNNILKCNIVKFET